MKHFITFAIICVVMWMLSIIVYVEQDFKQEEEDKFYYLCKLNAEYVLKNCFDKKNYYTEKCQLGLDILEYECTNINFDIHGYFLNRHVWLFWIIVLVGNAILSAYNYVSVVHKEMEQDEDDFYESVKHDLNITLI